MNAQPGDRIAGGLMAAAAMLSIVVMAHHPSGGDNAALANGVHGALMIFSLLLLVGFYRFAEQEGFGKFSVIAGFVAYCAGSIGNLLAATVNGFAVPGLSARGAAKDVFAFAWELNQALAYEAVFAISAAIALWGLALIWRGSRLVGVAGLAAGILPAALLAAGALDMHVSGAAMIYAVQALFSFIIGVRMAVRRA